MSLFLWRAAAVAALIASAAAWVRFMGWRERRAEAADARDVRELVEWLADLGTNDDDPVPYLPAERVRKLCADRAVIDVDWDAWAAGLTGEQA